MRSNNRRRITFDIEMTNIESKMKRIRAAERKRIRKEAKKMMKN